MYKKLYKNMIKHTIIKVFILQKIKTKEGIIIHKSSLKFLSFL